MTSEEHKKITGFNTPEESIAYDKGREDEETVLINWIINWDGSTNSRLGQILYDLCINTELNNEEKR